MRQILIDCYLDYLNNYLTVECYAENNGMSTEQAEILINLARDIARSLHPEA